jgi:hypothetical protein
MGDVPLKFVTSRMSLLLFIARRGRHHQAYKIVQDRALAWKSVALVPRGGIEPSPIQLKVHHFSNGGVPVYLPVDPALSSRPGWCDSVPPYPPRVRVTRYTKDIISAVCCAQMQIGTRP